MSPAPHPRMHGLTHVPGGPDPIPGLPTGTGGPGLEDVILAHSPVGLWKLDESSGTTAADSSGNGNDMTVASGYVGPTWAQAAGPPGTQTAQFVAEPGSSNAGTRFTRTLAAYTDEFSAGTWVNLTQTTFPEELIGQGTWHSIGGAGWQILWSNTTDKFCVSMASANFDIVANNVSVVDTWYLVGITATGGTVTMYIDGLAQADTHAVNASGSTATWLGNDGHNTSSRHGSDAIMSWAFITDTPISGAERLDIYEAGQTGGSLAEGLVWTSDGLGGASWQPPTGGAGTIEVTY